jgi:hypothetical protein
MNNRALKCEVSDKDTELTNDKGKDVAYDCGCPIPSVVNINLT